MVKHVFVSKLVCHLFPPNSKSLVLGVGQVLEELERVQGLDVEVPRLECRQRCLCNSVLEKTASKIPLRQGF